MPTLLLWRGRARLRDRVHARIARWLGTPTHSDYLAASPGVRDA